MLSDGNQILTAAVPQPNPIQPAHGYATLDHDRPVGSWQPNTDNDPVLETLFREVCPMWVGGWVGGHDVEPLISFF